MTEKSMIEFLESWVDVATEVQAKMDLSELGVFEVTRGKIMTTEDSLIIAKVLGLPISMRAVTGKYCTATFSYEGVVFECDCLTENVIKLMNTEPKKVKKIMETT